MNIMYLVLLNLILMLFPMLIYFMYRCYQELCMEKYNQVLFGVVLVSSIYLCFKFGNVRENHYVVLFCNLPIVVAYLKKQDKLAIMLSVIVSLYSYFFLNIFILGMVIKFIIYYIIYLLSQYKKVKDKTFILLIVVIQGFFLSFDYYGMIDHWSSFLELVLSITLFYLCPFFLLYLFKLADQVSSLYLTVSELERDKQLKNSLFKITHEVKNPIAVCKGYLDMLDVCDLEQVKRYVPIIKNEIGRSLDIMNDFMEFSKINIQKEVIDINLLLEDICDELKILMFNRKVRLDVHIMQNEVFIEGDYNRLKQVFINLVKNSLEAIDGNGNIKITTHLLKNTYYIEIVDDGIGMDEETIKQVKDMFFSTKKMGSGLGVSLSNEIIILHRGSLDYYSRVGNGTKVVVKLPVIVL